MTNTIHPWIHRGALIGVVAALALAVVPLGAAETAYSDPAGDSGAAPDVTTVTVSHTDAGVITVRIAARLAENTFVATRFDTDRYVATGADDRLVVVGIAPGGALVTLVTDTYINPLPGVAIAATYSAGVIELSFPRGTLGIDGQGFNFMHLSGSMDGGSTASDKAPDDGQWYYELTKLAPPPPAVVKPVIGKPLASPARPVAGRRFTVTFPVTRSDDGSPLAQATVACTTTVAGRVVPHRHTFGSGTVRATLTVPKTAKGKQLKLAVEVKAGSQKATKVVTFKVK